MCGIAGVANFSRESAENEPALASMIEVLIHRGPDGSGTHHAKGDRVHLAHTLLSIVGHGSNQQPLRIMEGQGVKAR